MDRNPRAELRNNGNNDRNSSPRSDSDGDDDDDDFVNNGFANGFGNTWDQDDNDIEIFYLMPFRGQNLPLFKEFLDGFTTENQPRALECIVLYNVVIKADYEQITELEEIYSLLDTSYNGASSLTTNIIKFRFNLSIRGVENRYEHTL